MKSLIRPAISMFVITTLITGVAYPAVVTVIAQKAFPTQSEGSMVSENGRPVGSSLIGQPFSDPNNFWGRPSATSPNPYNATASGGSNLAPSNPALVDAVKPRIEALRAGGSHFPDAVPADLVTASASGLDPDISPTAAIDQIPRVAAARKVDPAILTQLIAEHQQGRQFGFLGEPRINVLELNLALARLAKKSGPQ